MPLIYTGGLCPHCQSKLVRRLRGRAFCLLAAFHG